MTEDFSRQKDGEIPVTPLEQKISSQEVYAFDEVVFGVANDGVELAMLVEEAVLFLKRVGHVPKVLAMSRKFEKMMERSFNECLISTGGLIPKDIYEYAEILDVMFVRTEFMKGWLLI